MGGSFCALIILAARVRAWRCGQDWSYVTWRFLFSLFYLLDGPTEMFVDTWFNRWVPCACPTGSSADSDLDGDGL